MYKVHIDFETKGLLDLGRVGSEVYTSDPYTDILCCSFAMSLNDLKLRKPQHLKDLSSDLQDMVSDPSVLFVAHGAEFEQAVWRNIMVKRYGYPEIPIERWRCTMAKALQVGLPASLEQAAKALGCEQQKADGKAMLALSKPKKKGIPEWWSYEEKPDLFEAMYSYCEQDVRVEMELDEKIPDLPTREQRIWFLDQRINQRGIRFDLPLINNAIKIGTAHQEVLKSRFADRIEGKFGPRQRKEIAKWLKSLGIDAKDTKATTLAKLEVDDETRITINMLQEANKSSLAKFPTMLRCSTKLGVAVNMHQYHGGHTKRWAGRKIQPQNLPRTLWDMFVLCDAIMTGDYEYFASLYKDVNHGLSQATRGAIVPRRGKKFYIGDFSAVEAVVLAWLTGEEERLEEFRNGKDPYIVDAGVIYQCDEPRVDKPKRAVGKVSRLSLGYQGGINAYVNMASSYYVDLQPVADGPLYSTATKEERAKCEWSWNYYLKTKGGDEPCSKEIGLVSNLIKLRWRAANPNIVAFWQEVEDAAIRAVRYPGKTVKCGKVSFFMHGIYLCCKGPSGGIIHYPFPKLHESKFQGKPVTKLSFRKVKNKAFIREFTYGGRLTENIVQWIGRELLADAMLRLEKNGFEDIVMHVHDEVVCEVDQDCDRFDEFIDCLKQLKPWAEGLPLGAAGFETIRYRKEA